MAEERRLAPTNRSFTLGADMPDLRVGGIEGAAQPGLLTIKPPLIVGEHVVFLSAFKERGLLDPLHRHDDHESIGFQLKGRQRIIIGDEEFLSEAGDAWYHAPGVIHMSEALEDTIQLEMKSPPMRTWGDVAPSGPLTPGNWLRSADPSGRRLPRCTTPFVDASETPAERAAAIEGVAGSGLLEITPLITGYDIALSSVARSKGHIDAAHRHDDHETIGYLISGRLRLVIGGEEWVAGPGDSWYHGPGVTHSSEALEDCVNLTVKTPPVQTWRS